MTNSTTTGRIGIVFGTRPEMIKLAPLVRALGDEATLIHTGQHYDVAMSQAFLDEFHLNSPHFLPPIGGRSRGAQIGAATIAIEEFLQRGGVEAIVVQGDTNSGLAGALAANATDRPLVHLEAGLRSYDRRMPEEHNRVVIDALSDLCCVPHASNVENLRREGIPDDRVVVTGSTLSESVEWMLRPQMERRTLVNALGLDPGGYILATVHRVENVDDPERLRTILSELASLDLPVVLPLHPRTASRADEFGLAGLLSDLRTIEPLPYGDFLALAAECSLLVSDSGGVQEEATILKRPVVVIRESTERPELLGTFAYLTDVGADISQTVSRLLRSGADLHRRLEALPYPYGHNASDRCALAIRKLLDSPKVHSS